MFTEEQGQEVQLPNKKGGQVASMVTKHKETSLLTEQQRGRNMLTR